MLFTVVEHFRSIVVVASGLRAVHSQELVHELRCQAATVRLRHVNHALEVSQLLLKLLRQITRTSRQLQSSVPNLRANIS